MADLAIVPTGSALGAEIRHIDLRAAISRGLKDRLRRALLQYHVLLFRDQRISEVDQVRFTRLFGEPVPHVREQPDRPVREIFVVSNVTERGRSIGALGSYELTFHSDLSYLQQTGSLSVLYAVEVPAHGGDTSWANCAAAYDALPDDLKARVENLVAIHRHGEVQQNPPVPASHPVVRTHPETGRRALYVSPQFTRRIQGVSDAESGSLLERLFAHAVDPRFVWTHRWRAGDLVLWDNRCTMHRREAFDENARRIMRRTQILGDQPY